MLHKNNSSVTTIIFSILAVIVCLLIGKGITLVNYSIPLLLVVGLFAFMLAFLQTNIAMVLLIFAMLLSPEVVLGALTKRDIVLRVDDLLIIAFSIAWLARTAINPKLHFIRRTPLNRLIGLYVLIFTFTTLKGMITTERLSILKGSFYILKYMEYFLIFYLASSITHEKKQVKMYLKAFLITFAIVNVYAFTQIGTHGRVSAPFEGRVGEPNTLGGYQILLLALILGLMIHMKSSRWKAPLGILAIFSLIPFTYTLSRSSYAAIIPMYFSLIFFAQSKAKNVLMGVLIIVIVFSFFFFPQNVKDRIKDTFVPQKQENIIPVKFLGVSLGPSGSARIRDWISNFHDWKSKPFLGYGVTGKGFLDSQYARTLVELGGIGFVVFLGLMWTIFRSTLRIYQRTQDDMLKGLALGFLAGHVGMLVHAITANTFIIIRIMEPYWFLAALVMIIPYIENPKKETEQNENKLRKRYNLTRILNYEQRYHVKV